MTERAFFDVSWMAVRGRADAALLTALDLSAPSDASWARGLSAVLGDHHDFDADLDACLSRVFVVDVPGRDWCCLLGGWFADAGEDDRIVEACKLASRLRGDAYAFTTQGQMDWFAWMAASDGAMRRRFVSGDGPEPAVVEGAPLSGEEGVDVGEDAVFTLASLHAAGPDELGARPSGLLVTTSWGRANGLPRRRLEE